MERHAVIACVGLGANLGDRVGALESALHALESARGIRLVRSSPVIETTPMLPPGGLPQPPYLNAAAVLETTLSARELLDVMLDIERTHGRDRAGESRWAPRTLDLDLLLYGDCVIDEPGLTVPHPEMAQRFFVMRPLAAVAPNMVHPVLGERIEDLFMALDTPG